MEKTVAVLKKEGEFAAGVFTSRGLFATSIPRKSESEALRAINAEELRRNDSSEHLQVLEAVFALSYGNEFLGVDNIQLDLSEMTEKQQKVLEVTRSISRGETRTYGEVARLAGLPRAARFVGNVMASNRLAPLIPCHRVVANSGLGGYGFGLDRKRMILAKESGFAD